MKKKDHSDKILWFLFFLFWAIGLALVSYGSDLSKSSPDPLTHYGGILLMFLGFGSIALGNLCVID